jgi:hypothetical protein
LLSVSRAARAALAALAALTDALARVLRIAAATATEDTLLETSPILNPRTPLAISASLPLCQHAWLCDIEAGCVENTRAQTMRIWHEEESYGSSHVPLHYTRAPLLGPGDARWRRARGGGCAMATASSISTG